MHSAILPASMANIIGAIFGGGRQNARDGTMLEAIVAGNGQRVRELLSTSYPVDQKTEVSPENPGRWRQGERCGVWVCAQDRHFSHPQPNSGFIQLLRSPLQREFVFAAPGTRLLTCSAHAGWVDTSASCLLALAPSCHHRDPQVQSQYERQRRGACATCHHLCLSVWHRHLECWQATTCVLHLAWPMVLHRMQIDWVHSQTSEIVGFDWLAMLHLMKFRPMLLSMPRVMAHDTGACHQVRPLHMITAKIWLTWVCRALMRSRRSYLAGRLTKCVALQKGRTAFHLAAFQGAEACMRKVLFNGADVESADMVRPLEYEQSCADPDQKAVVCSGCLHGVRCG